LQYDEGILGGISAYTRGVGRLDLGADTLTYLKKILTSRVYDVAVESPLERANKVSDRVGSDIFLKREDLQKVREVFLNFGFRLRNGQKIGETILKHVKRSEILRLRVCGFAVDETLERSKKISFWVGSDNFLKREDLQKVSRLYAHQLHSPSFWALLYLLVFSRVVELP
jgi:hypothetical protein